MFELSLFAETSLALQLRKQVGENALQTHTGHAGRQADS